MRKLLTLTAALFVVSLSSASAAQENAVSKGADASAINPESLSLARQILHIGMPPERREATFFATMDQMVAQMDIALQTEIDDPATQAIVEKHKGIMMTEMKDILVQHLPNMMESWAVAYTNIFSEAELKDILDFVATPTGQRFFELSGAIMAEPNFAAANQAYMNEAMATMPVLQEAMLNDLIEYYGSKSDEIEQEAS